MDKNHIHIYLKLYDFEIHPDEVTKLLNLDPTESGVKGEKFFIGNKKSKIERVYSSNYWQYKETHFTKTKWHQEYVDEFINRILKPRIEEIRLITSQGSGELALVPHYYDEWNPGFDFKLDILTTIVDSGLILDMDVYFFSNDEN